MNTGNKFILWFFAVSILGLFAAFRISWQQDQVIPRGSELAFVFTIEKEPRFFEDSQLIFVGDARVYTDLFPRYRVGDRLKVEGKVDDLGRVFDPKVEKVGTQNSFLGHVSKFRNLIASNIRTYLPSKEATLVVGTVLGVDDIGEDFKEENN